MYTPPFSITAQAINRIADIAALTERYAIRMEQKDGLLLRRINRIKTIYSSLAIEGNNLTEAQVTDILDGKRVQAPKREITEVRNARETYELFPNLSPFKVQDMLKAHARLMKNLVPGAGHFRSGGVGVFKGSEVIHMAPPADRVPGLIQDLLNWVENAPDHLLIRSCVFHYEFEFIHPFADGNGRMGRLWQSLILSLLHPIFAHLPVENIVHEHQQAYYDAISASTAATDAAPFIEFMLGEIYAALRKRAVLKTDVVLNDTLNGGLNDTIIDGIIARDDDDYTPDDDILRIIRRYPSITLAQLGGELGISLRQMQRRMHDLQQRGIVERIGARKRGKWMII